MKNIGKLLKEIREVKGMSQIEAARRMGYTNNGWVATLESGKYMPEDGTLRKYADALEISHKSIFQIKRRAEFLDLGVYEDSIFDDVRGVPIIENPNKESIERSSTTDGKRYYPLPLEDNIRDKKELFGIEAQELSIVEEEIYPKDILIFEKNVEIRNGDFVLGCYHSKIFLKRYHEKAGFIKFRPNTSESKPIQKSDKALEVFGRLTRKITVDSYD